MAIYDGNNKTLTKVDEPGGYETPMLYFSSQTALDSFLKTDQVPQGDWWANTQEPGVLARAVYDWIPKEVYASDALPSSNSDAPKAGTFTLDAAKSWGEYDKYFHVSGGAIYSGNPSLGEASIDSTRKIMVSILIDGACAGPSATIDRPSINLMYGTWNDNELIVGVKSVSRWNATQVICDDSDTKLHNHWEGSSVQGWSFTMSGKVGALLFLARSYDLTPPTDDNISGYITLEVLE